MPQVVFKVVSPGNTLTKIAAKFEFYGVGEYYVYDPERGEMTGWRRVAGRLRVIEEIDGWVSPRLGVRFRREGGEVRLYLPDGRPFVSFVEEFCGTASTTGAGAAARRGGAAVGRAPGGVAAGAGDRS